VTGTGKLETKTNGGKKASQAVPPRKYSTEAVGKLHKSLRVIQPESGREPKTGETLLVKSV